MIFMNRIIKPILYGYWVNHEDGLTDTYFGESVDEVVEKAFGKALHSKVMFECDFSYDEGYCGYYRILGYSKLCELRIVFKKRIVYLTDYVIFTMNRSDRLLNENKITISQYNKRLKTLRKISGFDPTKLNKMRCRRPL